MATAHVAQILDHLVRDRASEPDLKLFAILDAARNERILAKLEASPHKRECLYRNAPPALEAAAPWLVELEQGGGAFLEWLVEEGWGDHWGIYLLSDASLGELRKHFRRFLKVSREDGSKLYFRFCDPRVARSYLPTCTQRELDFVMGPVSQLELEGDDPETLLRFTLDEEEGLNREVVHLGESTPAPVAPAAPSLPPEVAEVLADVGGANGGGGAQDVERIRDALLTHPGQAALLELLRKLDPNRFEEARGGVEPLRETLADLTETAFAPSGLEPALRSFPEQGSWKAAFVALAPGFEGWLPADQRAQLSAGCEVLVDLAGFAEQVQDQRARLREIQELKEADQEKRACNSALAALKAMRDKSAAWTAPQDDPKLEKARKGIERLIKRVEGRRDPSARSIVSGLTSVLVSLGAHGRDDSKEVARVARGVANALRATTSADGESSGEGGALPPAVARPRRYTMRRKALPFEREKLVIRDEQMVAMAEAVDRALVVRLVAHVKRAHPEQVEALGLERVKKIVASGLAKARQHGIQKVPAITILVDLMITIDPEFTELEEYAWARDLLETTFLDPNTIPAAIRAQLEE